MKDSVKERIEECNLHQSDTDKHPCFGAPSNKYARIHLPVAPFCNIQCGYCSRKFDCANDNRPGVTSKILSPEEALASFLYYQNFYNISVVGFAGPGDPLANWGKVKQTVALIKQVNPNILFCLSTNGLFSPLYADEIIEAGIRYITITINAISPSVSSRIYEYIRFNGMVLSGEEAGRILLEQQLEGIRRFKSHGIHLKVNTVVIPTINCGEIEKIAENVSSLGVERINLLPLLPVEGTPLSTCCAPSHNLMCQLKQIASRYLPVMSHCRLCRADSVGYLL